MASENPLVQFIRAQKGHAPKCHRCNRPATHAYMLRAQVPVPVCGLACALIGTKRPRENNDEEEEEEEEETAVRVEDVLPNEVWMMVFGYLNGDDLTAASALNRAAFALARQGQFIAKFRWTITAGSLAALARVPDQWYRFVQHVRVDTMNTLSRLDRSGQLQLRDVVIEDGTLVPGLHYPATMVNLHIIDARFNSQNLTHVLPPTLRELKISSDTFNEKLNGLPPALNVLDLSKCPAFNRKLKYLPRELDTLMLGAGFTQSLVRLPDTLLWLAITKPDPYNGPIRFPDGLVILHLPGGYAGLIAGSVPQLEELVLGTSPERNFDARNWPNLRIVHFMSTNPVMLSHVSHAEGRLKTVTFGPGGGEVQFDN